MFSIPKFHLKKELLPFLCKQCRREFAARRQDRRPKEEIKVRQKSIKETEIERDKLMDVLKEETEIRRRNMVSFKVDCFQMSLMVPGTMEKKVKRDSSSP